MGFFLLNRKSVGILILAWLNLATKPEKLVADAAQVDYKGTTDEDLSKFYQDNYAKISKPAEFKNTVLKNVLQLTNEFVTSITRHQNARNPFLINYANKVSPLSDRQYIWSIQQRKQIRANQVESQKLSQFFTDESSQAVNRLVAKRFHYLNSFSKGMSFNLKLKPDAGNNSDQSKAQQAHFVKYGLALSHIESQDDVSGKEYALVGELSYEQLANSRKAQVEWTIKPMVTMSEYDNMIRPVDTSIFEDTSQGDSRWEQFQKAIYDALPDPNFKISIKPKQNLSQQDGGFDGMQQLFDLSVEQSQDYYSFKHTWDADGQPTLSHIIRANHTGFGDFERHFDDSLKATYTYWGVSLYEINPMQIGVTVNHLDNSYGYKVEKSIVNHHITVSAVKASDDRFWNCFNHSKELNYELSYSQYF